MQFTHLSVSMQSKCLFSGRSSIFARQHEQPLKNSIRRSANSVALGKATYLNWHSTVSTAAKSNHDAPSDNTLYAFRVVTGKDLLSGLSEPTAGIQVGVIGEANGSALIQRIGRAEHSWSGERPPNGWGFFEAGSVDELFWIGPEINPVAAIWLAPETGGSKWDSINNTSMSSRLT